MSVCQSHEQCVDNSLRKAEEICKTRGLRFTKLRRKVLKLICSSPVPAKAYDLLKQMSKDKTTKPPVVYRSLDFLLHNGLIHRLNSINSYVSCQHPLEHQSCYFLICEECGKVEECCDDDITGVIQQTINEYCFYAKQTNLEIIGLCGECVSKEFKVRLNVKNENIN